MSLNVRMHPYKSLGAETNLSVNYTNGADLTILR